MGSTGQAGRTLDGGKFDFHDGGTYCGSWEDGKAHGHGVCTGPKGQGVYTGSWHYGFEVSGVYSWPSGSTYEGQWQNGKRHGLGVETRGRWVYRGEWTQGFKGRYGVRQSTTSPAKYEGTWANGLQDGYGSETYADTGTYKGQWLRGLRHGYGVRTSAQFGQASLNRGQNNPIGSSSSLRSDGAGDPLADRDRKVDGRGGFVLRARSDEVRGRRGSLVERSNIKSVIKKMRRQKSTGDIQSGRASGSIRSTGSSTSCRSTDSGHSAYTTGDVPDEGSNASFVIEMFHVPQDEQLDASVIERYNGEWKHDKRSGFGVSERSDGLKYEGEWYNNKKYGYGVTTFKDGSREEGKYKNNVLITSNKKKHLFLLRSAKFRERIEAAVAAAQRAAKIAIQKEDIAITRTATGRGKGEQADIAATHAKEDAGIARTYAKQFAPDFQQPGTEPAAWRATDGGLSTSPKTDEYMDEDAMASTQGGPGYTQPSLAGPQDMINDEGGGIMRKSSLAQGSESDITKGYTGDHRSRGGRSRHKDSTSIPTSILNDRFDHYNKPPSRASSRDRSVDRFVNRGQTPVPQELINPRSRAPSAHRTPAAADCTPDSGVFEDEVQPPPLITGGSRRSSKPSSLLTGDAISLTGNGPVVSNLPYHIPANQEEAESLLRQRACGQEITPSMTPMGPVKRTESLYINPIKRTIDQAKKAPPPAVALRRKKSLPDAPPPNAPLMSREETSVLSSHQREAVRRKNEETERYRSNPLLYLTSPSVQDWFSRQRLVLFILVLNFSMALVFLKLLS